MRRTGHHGSRRGADARGAGRASAVRAGCCLRSRARCARLAPRRLRGRRRRGLGGTRAARRGVGGGSALQDGHRLSPDVGAEIRVGESRSGRSEHGGIDALNHRRAGPVVAGDCATGVDGGWAAVVGLESIVVVHRRRALGNNKARGDAAVGRVPARRAGERVGRRSRVL